MRRLFPRVFLLGVLTMAASAAVAPARAGCDGGQCTLGSPAACVPGCSVGCEERGPVRRFLARVWHRRCWQCSRR